MTNLLLKIIWQIGGLPSKDVIIEGFPDYTINREGIIKQCINGCSIIKTPYINNDGYLAINLKRDDGTRSVQLLHRLLAKTFIPNPNGYLLVRHLDDNKLNNTLSNLAWGTYKDNLEDAKRNNKYKGLSVEAINKSHELQRKRVWAKKDNFYEEYDSISECSKALGIPRKSIYNVSIGRHLQSHGYSFGYLKSAV